MKSQTSMRSFGAIYSIAVDAEKYRTEALYRGVVPLLAALAMAGCSALPDKPMRSVMYDFGPGALAVSPASRQTPLAPIAIDDITTSGGALDNMSVLYRLAYLDEQQLRTYAQARWSAPPALLVRQRLRDQLGLRRAIFNAGDSVSLNRSQNAILPLLLRLELEEFSHLFTTPDTSVGLIRMRATLVDVTPAGEKLVGQRILIVQRPATSSDAPGGVRALALATDAAIEEINQWLQQATVRQ